MKIISIILLILSLSSCNTIKKQAERAAIRNERFTVDLRSPQLPIGEIQAQFNNLFPMPGIRTVDIVVIYFPYEDAVCLNYRLNTYTYHFFWHKQGRDSFVKALEQYNADFEARRLREGRNSRTKSQYGTVKEFFLYWQQMQQARLTSIANGNMDIELGYYFRDKSPFFAVTQLQAYFESPTFFQEDNDLSPEIPIFFTRAQANELAALFDQDFLQSLAPVRQPAAGSRTPAGVEVDSY